ncbi:ArsC family reductase [Oceanicoccus sp. KOV_DT_Chl]|uniref:ArsC family reductase n=1 Tax=Oceanicoccus sp. KOV_DT_Chl TaxID=1904639 RepID=UPI000C7BCC26|nr:ArsC family reductase [Oceanicoccus sp. KOV_DT_Chl]
MTTATTLYGIKNCDTVKKARQWLDQHQIAYHFHDFRQDGIGRAEVEQWIKQLGWETVVNKRSTSWKELTPAKREAMDAATAATAILENPTLVKRPLLALNGQFSVGFKAADYQEKF